MFDSRGETRLALCLLVISALLNGLHCMSSNVLFTEKFLDTIVPVFHNVQAGMVIPLAGLVKDRGYCSLSLRHPEALSSLQALSDHVRTKYPDSMCRIGASTVANIDQVDLSLQAGAQFISTKDFLPEVLQYCNAINIPVLCAVKSMKESVQAIELGAKVLKLYPSAQMYEYTFQEIAKLRKESANRISILASGGINGGNLLKFKEYGATHFAIGYDMKVMSCSEVDHDLALCDEILRRQP